MAKMKFRFGSMKSGKSQELIRVYYNYKLKGEKALVLTSAIDNRDGVGYVSSRAGGRIEAVPIENIKDLMDVHNTLSHESYSCVLIDEVQFMSFEMIEYIKNKIVLELDIPVLVYGLKTDFMNKLFEGTQACFVFSEDIREVETVCQYCNKKATMNLRLSGGVPIKSGAQVLIGDSEYVQVCHKHWNEPEGE